jgi:hypothetical protein
VRLERLTRGHVVAAVAALVLLLVMAMDWYGSQAADLAHRINSSAATQGSQGGEAQAVRQDADSVIARDEKNAWQEQASIDRVLLAFLLLSVFLPLFAAAHRAAGRRARPPWTPSAFAAIVAAIAALLVAFRILNQPGSDVTTTVKLGAPLGLVMLAIIGLGAASAFQGEANWAELRRQAVPESPASTDEPDASPAT